MMSKEETGIKDKILIKKADEREETRSNIKDKETNLQQYIVFILCLIFLFVIYAVDIISGGKYTETILETVKTLCFTICGYLFGRSKLN